MSTVDVPILTGQHSPKNPEELFNLRHSQLRNAVERIFGVLKKRYKIVREHNDFGTSVQARIVLAVCTLHNFIKAYDPGDMGDDDESGSDNESEDESARQTGEDTGETMPQEFDERRDSIAREMWASYQAIVQRGGRSQTD